MLEQIGIDYHQGANWNKNITNHSQQFHLYILTYGSCSFENELTSIQAVKGDFVLAPDSCHYTEKSANNSLHQKYSISFTASPALLQAIPLLNEQHWLHHSPGIYDRSIELLRPLWKEVSEKQPFSELRIASFLLDTLALWHRELARGELAPASIIHIDRMKQYIQTHYRQKITKEVLGDYIRRSPSYAAMLFKKGTGQTISEYVHAVRMKTAIYMLAESMLTITEISEYLGYSDVSYFQRLFKRTFGYPPSEYMLNHRETRA